MSSNQDNGWERIFQHFGRYGHREEDEPYFVAKKDNIHVLGYYPGVEIVCTHCCKVLKAGPYAQHQGECLKISDKAAKEKVEATKDSAKFWKAVRGMPVLQGEENRCKVHVVQK